MISGSFVNIDNKLSLKISMIVDNIAEEANESMMQYLTTFLHLSNSFAPKF